MSAPRKKIKNLVLLQQRTQWHAAAVLLVAMLVAAIGMRWDIVSSVIIGGLFSFLIFKNMLKSPATVLLNRKPKLFYFDLMKRLLLYGVPVALGLKITYLKLWVILVSLVSFPLALVLSVMGHAIVKYKKQGALKKPAHKKA